MNVERKLKGTEMLRLVFLALLASCCQSGLYRPPVATFQGTVAILDPDPLCHLNKGKRSEELLDDILTYQILKQWIVYNPVTVPYRVAKDQKDHTDYTVVRCLVH